MPSLAQPKKQKPNGSYASVMCLLEDKEGKITSVIPGEAKAGGPWSTVLTSGTLQAHSGTCHPMSP